MATGRVGRVERALDYELRRRAEVEDGDKAFLRAQARAVDIAERNHDPDEVTRATHGYLELRLATGLTGRVEAEGDTFAQLLRELSEPRVGDPEVT